MNSGGDVRGTGRLNPSLVQPLGRELGAIIAQFRQALRMSREDLASLAGVQPKAVEHWEKGRRIINNESLPRVARALGLLPSELYLHAERRMVEQARCLFHGTIVPSTAANGQG